MYLGVYIVFLEHISQSRIKGRNSLKRFNKYCQSHCPKVNTHSWSCCYYCLFWVRVITSVQLFVYFVLVENVDQLLCFVDTEPLPHIKCLHGLSLLTLLVGRKWDHKANCPLINCAIKQASWPFTSRISHTGSRTIIPVFQNIQCLSSRQNSLLFTHLSPVTLRHPTQILDWPFLWIFTG